MLARTIAAKHSTFFKFLIALHAEQNYQEMRMAKIESGHDPDEVPKQYREMNERLHKTVKTYSSDDHFDCIYYLNTLAFNIKV